MRLNHPQWPQRLNLPMRPYLQSKLCVSFHAAGSGGGGGWGGGCKRRKNCEVVAWCLPVSVGRGVVP